MERLKLKHLSAIAAGMPLLGFGSSAWAQATSCCVSIGCTHQVWKRGECQDFCV